MRRAFEYDSAVIEDGHTSLMAGERRTGWVNRALSSLVDLADLPETAMIVDGVGRHSNCFHPARQRACCPGLQVAGNGHWLGVSGYPALSFCY